MAQEPLAHNVTRIADLDMPVNGEASPQSNDVDGRSLIYMIDRNNGFDILEYQG